MVNDTDTIKLADLVGRHVLDGRGEFVFKDSTSDSWNASEDATVVVLRLDGQCYWFQEDPSDGYRSDLGLVKRCTTEDLPPGSFAAFEPMTVMLRVRTKPTVEYITRDDVLYGVNEQTGLVMFEIGTVDIDDYYPSFVHAWYPEGKAAEWLAGTGRDPMTESQTETTSSPYADALAEIERLRDVVRDAATLLEAKSDRGARLEWAKTIRARGERP